MMFSVIVDSIGVPSCFLCSYLHKQLRTYTEIVNEEQRTLTRKTSNLNSAMGMINKINYESDNQK